ncbi:hypothetical protein [Maritalea sp.]|jgi:hypothetical protein|uniref:hypothetical protein n=1 Tax=Maritalea sp. TaxID=2003361 RepID=UPI0039E3D38D
MNIATNEQDMQGIQRALNSPTGRNLSQAQRPDALAIVDIVHREIHRVGKFTDKLGDYANALARSEKFDAMKANVIVRELYKERYGETMKVTLDNLKAREKSLNPEQKALALSHAKDVGAAIEHGDKMPFFRALDNQSVMLAEALRITQSGAKRQMAETFTQSTGKDFYEHNKVLEKEFYTPQIEAEREQRTASRQHESKQTLKQSQ